MERMASIDQRISQELFARKLDGELYPKAIEGLKRETPDMESFSDLYGDEVIQRDKAYVAQRHRQFDAQSAALPPREREAGERNKKLATVLEAILLEHAELSDWLGSSAHTVKTTELDDIQHGVDVVLEFTQEGGPSHYTATSIDATFSVAGAQKKIGDIEWRLSKGQGAEVKYFESSSGTFKGKLSHLPRIVLGIERAHVEEIANLWLQKKNKELGEHPIQRLIAEQGLAQLRFFEQHLEYTRTDNKAVLLQTHGQAKAIFEKIAREKSHISLARLEHDRVHELIMSMCK